MSVFRMQRQYFPGLEIGKLLVATPVLERPSLSSRPYFPPVSDGAVAIGLYPHIIHHINTAHGADTYIELFTREIMTAGLCAKQTNKERLLI